MYQIVNSCYYTILNISFFDLPPSNKDRNVVFLFVSKLFKVSNAKYYSSSKGCVYFLYTENNFTSNFT